MSGAVHPIGASVNGLGHLIVTLSNGGTIDGGVAPGGGVITITEGTPSTPSSTVTAPNAVNALGFTIRTSTSIKLVWTPSGTGSPATSFNISTRFTGQSAWTLFQAGVTANSLTVTGLTYNEPYDFQVVAVNSAGPGTPAVLTNTAPRCMVSCYPGLPSGLAPWISYFGRSPEIVTVAANQTSWANLYTPGGSGPDSIAYTCVNWNGAGPRLIFGMPILTNDLNPNNLSYILTGQKNSTFLHLGAELVSNGFANAIIRLGWEFNTTGQPWNAASPATVVFAEVFRYVVNLLRTVSGQAFLFEWCALAGGTTSIAELAYPGNDVVDIIALDVYDNEGSYAATLGGPFGLTWVATFAAANNKPIGIPEFGCGTNTGGDDVTFISSLAAWILVNPVMYACEFNAATTIFANNNVGVSPFPNSAAALYSALGGTLTAPDLPAAPAVPTGLTISGSAQQSSITLQWSAATGAAVQQYVLWYRVNGTTPWFVAANAQGTPVYITGSATSATVPNLNPLTNYDFLLLASNPGGNAQSSVYTAETVAATKPGTVVITGYIAYSEAIQVNFAPPTTGGTPVAYTIQYQTPGQGGWTPATTTLAYGATFYQITGLTPQATYNVQIIATNSGGSGVPAEIDNIVTPAIPDAPGAVPTLVVANVADTVAQLYWTSPTTGGPVQNYTVQRSTNGGATWTVLTNSLTAGTLTYEATGLTPATSYVWSVFATNANATLGGLSPVVSAPTLASGVPGPPVYTGASANSSQCLKITGINVPPYGGGVTTYYPYSRLSAAGNNPAGAWVRGVQSNTPGVPNGTLYCTGLLPGTAYDLTLAASNSYGTGPMTYPYATTVTTLAIDTADAPGTPLYPAIVNPTETGFTVEWAAPETGGTYNLYSVNYRITGSGNAYTSVTTAFSSITLTTLAIATEYDVTINTVGATLSGTPTAVINGTTT